MRFSDLIIIGALAYMCTLLYHIAKEPPVVETVIKPCSCKELPKDYFVVTTKEQELCVDFTGEKRVYKETESATTIK